MAICRIR